MKNRLLIAGCGDIALRASELLGKRYHLYGLCRSTENFDKLRAHGIRPVPGDLDSPSSLSRLSGIAAHTVLHLAPPPGEGKRDSRTAHLLAALAKTALNAQGRILPQQLVYISTSGVYGNCAGMHVNENRPVNPESERAWRRVDAERQIRSWGMRHGVRVSVLRVPGIYAENRLPLARLRRGTPVLQSSEDSYTNHIHADDLVRMIDAALRFGKSGRIYNASDDSALKMGDYFDLVADHFKLPRPLRISRQEAEEQIAPGLLSFMRESRRLTNDRIKRELRIRLLYPTVTHYLSELDLSSAK